MLKKLIGLCFLVVIVTAIAIVNFSMNELNRPLALEGDSATYQVGSGYSLKRVLADFHRSGWIDYPQIHEYWLRYHDKTAIQRGEYVLSANETVELTIERFINGDKILRSVQFIEGKTFKDYLRVLSDNSHLEQTLAGLTEAEILAKLDPELINLEGWLYPDTYLFETGTTDLDILKLSYSNMQAVLDELWRERSSEAAVTTPYEALILASIVEKETGAARERPEISGVFTRRLQLEMRLQTDPTVIYGLGDSFNGNLTRKHLRTDTPYNTYTRSGLPPSPIANPGKAAIEAALHPAEGNTLFFVAKGDGTHYFSATLDEHNAAVLKYQRYGRRKDYQSAPAAEESH